MILSLILIIENNHRYQYYNEMTFSIRPAKHEDAEDIIKVHVTSIRTICSKDYSPMQIQAWAGRKFRPELWKHTIDRDFVWIVENNLQILGFGHLAIMSEQIGEIMGLYFIPPALGQGLGKKMFKTMLDVAQEHKLLKLSLYSTITAKSFYQMLGFFQSAGDDTIEMQGIAIPCFPMEYIL